MQVGLKTASLTTSAPASAGRGGIDAPHSVGRVSAPDAVSRSSAFPEAALLSRRPMRYNVQLNQQLTAVQQADSYLAKTETQLLQLRQSTARGGDASAQAQALQTHLARRTQLSGGTVDRHMTASLEQKSTVNFTLPGSEKLLSQSGGETLVFSLGGRQREMVAVALPEDATPRQTLIKLNVGLGRLGIHATQAGGQLTFSVDESRWERVSQQLTVRGEGKHYPADAFTLLAPQAESASSDEMLALSTRREREGQVKLQHTLDHITGQRSRLRQQQERVSARINDMATTYSPKQALETSRGLGEALARSGSSYTALSQTQATQANVRLATVKNLLG